jgi:hypothetical protein
MDNTRNPFSRQFEIVLWSTLAATVKWFESLTRILTVKPLVWMHNGGNARTFIFGLAGFLLGISAGILVIWIIF